MLYLVVFVSCICSLAAISLMAAKKKRHSVVIIFGVMGIVTGFIGLAISSPRNTLTSGLDYLGIIVAILALLCTLLLGMQLYHVFRLKEDADEVHKAKNGIDKYSSRMEELIKQSEDLALKIGQMTKDTDKMKGEIKHLKDGISGLEKLAEHGVYVGETVGEVPDINITKPNS